MDFDRASKAMGQGKRRFTKTPERRNNGLLWLHSSADPQHSLTRKVLKTKRPSGACAPKPEGLQRADA